MVGLGRRDVLAGLAVLGARPAFAGAVEGAPGTLMVAGPPGGRLDRWADVLIPSVSRGMVSPSGIVRQNVGGIDGVTGANQFEARGEPDGRTALLVPGTAALSWLTGESRAHFDPARWVPVWAGTSSAVLVSRSALIPGSKLHVVAGGPAGPELPVLLALDLMGVDVVLSSSSGGDAMLVQGPQASAWLAAGTQSGFQPVMSLGVMGTSGRLERDPNVHSVPTAMDLLQGRAPAEMLGALQAASIAVQLEAGLVLPALTPAASVSQWRRASGVLQQDADVLREASRLGVRVISPDAVAACTSGIAGHSSALLALRNWLAARYDWRPA